MANGRMDQHGLAVYEILAIRQRTALFRILHTGFCSHQDLCLMYFANSEIIQTTVFYEWLRIATTTTVSPEYRFKTNFNCYLTAPFYRDKVQRVPGTPYKAR